MFSDLTPGKIVIILVVLAIIFGGSRISDKTDDHKKGGS